MSTKIVEIKMEKIPSLKRFFYVQQQQKYQRFHVNQMNATKVVCYIHESNNNNTEKKKPTNKRKKNK